MIHDSTALATLSVGIIERPDDHIRKPVAVHIPGGIYRPSTTRLILVGVVDGVYERDPLRDPAARRIPEISTENWTSVRSALGGSHATDVTGGMLAKVEGMVNLVRQLPGLTVHLVSGERPGALQGVLSDPATAVGGTVIR